MISMHKIKVVAFSHGTHRVATWFVGPLQGTLPETGHAARQSTGASTNPGARLIHRNDSAFIWCLR